MSQFTQQREQFQSEPGKDYYTDLRPELSRGIAWRMGEGRFLVITVTTAGPKSHGSVFETKEGLRFIVAPATTLQEAESKLASAAPGAKIFAVRPHFSMPAPDWIAADPSFWAVSRGQQ
jgi:hypothetical protein